MWLFSSLHSVPYCSKVVQWHPILYNRQDGGMGAALPSVQSYCFCGVLWGLLGWFDGTHGVLLLTSQLHTYRVSFITVKQYHNGEHGWFCLGGFFERIQIIKGERWLSDHSLSLSLQTADLLQHLVGAQNSNCIICKKRYGIFYTTDTECMSFGHGNCGSLTSGSHSFINCALWLEDYSRVNVSLPPTTYYTVEIGIWSSSLLHYSRGGFRSKC